MTILLNNINSFLQNDVLTLLLTIIWFFSFSLILSDLLNKKQGEMYLLSFVISAILLFAGGIFKNLYFFYYIGWFLIFIYYCYLLIIKNRKSTIKNIDFASTIIFILIFIVLYVLYQNKGLVATDEFTTWAPMVREMVQHNKFYCVPDSSLLAHKDYPPFFALIELMFCLFKGEYKECYLYIGLLSFYFSIAIAVSSHKNKIIDKIIVIALFALLGFSAQELTGPI